METNKIAELLEIIERILSAIKDESTERTNKMLFGWQILSGSISGRAYHDLDIEWTIYLLGYPRRWGAPRK